MKTCPGRFLVVVAALLGLALLLRLAMPSAVFRAGACSMDVSPKEFPVVVNGGFLPKSADRVHHPLHMRWLVLDDGATRLALGVLDSCMIPSEFVNEVKARAQQATGIPPDRIMISATHTHSAPSLMQALGTPHDSHYPAFVLPLIIEGLKRAVDRLEPAHIGWTTVPAPQHTHTRVWIRRPDKMMTDPFGDVTVRANMHPGWQNPDAIGPSGPSDPAITLLAVRTPGGRPIAVFANYAMHYFGAPPVSADYFGLFAEKLGPLLGAPEGFVGIMSQGTSGDQHWMDYSRPRPSITLDTYADQLARIAVDAYQTIEFKERAPLAMRAQTLSLATRQPDEKRLAWARQTVAAMGDRAPKDRTEVYAREQLWVVENPVRPVTLQALRVGDLGIATWPCEVFALSGLLVKAQSPFPLTMNVELANGGDGYIPPPELYPLGGYNTWPCRTAGLEPSAAPKMVDALLGLLEQVGGKPRRDAAVTHGPYPRAVLDSKPVAYWRMEDWGGPVAHDASGANGDATYGPGIARWLDGPDSPAFSGPGTVNRCVHLAGGHLQAQVNTLKTDYTSVLWFWNGLPGDARTVTGILFARGSDMLSIGGTGSTPDRLVFAHLAGHTPIAPKTWNQVALVRNGSRVAVYLNGNVTPEIAGETPPDAATEVHVGGAPGSTESFEGKLDEVALYDRALPPEEIRRHFQLAGPDAVATHFRPVSQAGH